MSVIQLDQLERALRYDPFDFSDRAFYRFLKESYAEENELVFAAAALCLSAAREGHSFLNLANPELPDQISEVLQNDWPSPSEWETIAECSPSIGRPGDNSPLILGDESALYLYRYFSYEDDLAKSVFVKAGQPKISAAASTDTLPISDRKQTEAVKKALENRFYLISGGPGTGKTTTVLAYLVSCIQSTESPESLRFAVAAPTGKAAAKVSSSIKDGLARFELEDSIANAILSIPCQTIHRLLESIPRRTSFRRNQKRPIDYDVLVVDESSMIDLPLMKKLMDAVPDDCSIVLLGDDNQLSSVEVGSVFSDLVRSTSNNQNPLFGKSTHLEKTFRFKPDSSIHRICLAFRNGESHTFKKILNENQNDFLFHPMKPTASPNLSPILNLVVEAYSLRAKSANLAQAYSLLSQFIVLSPLNHGPYGANAINRISEERIRRQQNLPSGDFYSGQPILVLENNYDLGLFNGDLGIIWPDDSGELFAWFNNSEGTFQKVRTTWLPRHSTAHCLTIHKSQGSEFEHVAGVFSPENSEFVTRELIYTCVSRAKSKITLFGNVDALCSAIDRRVNRATRLEARIAQQAHDTQSR